MGRRALRPPSRLPGASREGVLLQGDLHRHPRSRRPDPRRPHAGRSGRGIGPALERRPAIPTRRTTSPTCAAWRPVPAPRRLAHRPFRPDGSQFPGQDPGGLRRGGAGQRVGPRPRLEDPALPGQAPERDSRASRPTSTHWRRARASRTTSSSRSTPSSGSTPTAPSSTSVTPGFRRRARRRSRPRRARKRGPNYLRTRCGERLGDRDRPASRCSSNSPSRGDKTDDPTANWPDDRKTVDGRHAGAQRGRSPRPRTAARSTSSTRCALTDGIEPSDDPILRYRPRAYDVSARRRMRDVAS